MTQEDDELVKRLRWECQPENEELLEKAASTITRLNADLVYARDFHESYANYAKSEIALLRKDLASALEALKPFARENNGPSNKYTLIEVEYCYRAAAELAKHQLQETKP